MKNPVGRHLVSGICKFVVILFVGLLTASPVAAAQVIPGRWEKVDVLPRGESITVTLASGHRGEYKFIGSDPLVLIVTSMNGNETRMAKADVQTIVRQRHDPIRNGVLIGTGVGFACGFLALAAFNAKATATGPIWDRENVGYYVA